MSCSVNGTNGNFLSGNTSLPSVNSDFSCCLWGALTLKAGFATFLSLENGSGGGFQFYVDTSTRTPHYATLVNDVHFPGGDFTDGQWNWYGMSHSTGGATTTLYRSVNGGAISSSSFAETIPAVTLNKLVLYNEGANDEPTNGNLFGFKIWTAALSAREISSEMACHVPRHQLSSVNRYIPILNTANAGEAYVGRGLSLTKTGTLTDSRKMPPVPWSPRNTR